MEKAKEIILSTYLFRGVSEALEEITLNEIKTFKKGEIIYDENFFSKSIGIVISGKAKAVSLSGAGLLSYFETGSIFGAAAVFGESSDYISRIEAVKECTVAFIPQDTLTEIFKRFPKVAVNYISFLSSRIRFLNEKLSFMMQDSAEARLYAYLHKRGGYEGKMTALADALCIGRTTLYRTLENLEQNNLITRKGTKVKVIL